MNIDELYKQKFESFSASDSGPDWAAMNKRMKHKNFTRFNFMRFNVYYVLFFVSITAFSSYTSVKNYVLHREIKTMEKKVAVFQELVDSMEYISDFIPLIMPDSVRINLDKSTIPTLDDYRPVLRKLKAIQADTSGKELQALADTLRHSLIKPDSSIQTKKVVKKVIKKVVVKQNVIINDSVGKH